MLDKQILLFNINIPNNLPLSKTEPETRAGLESDAEPDAEPGAEPAGQGVPGAGAGGAEPGGAGAELLRRARDHRRGTQRIGGRRAAAGDLRRGFDLDIVFQLVAQKL